MTTLLVVLLIGATIRLTTLITSDTLLEPPRSWVERRMPARIAYLPRCDWCISVWVGFAVFPLGWYAPDTAVWIVSGALTASLVTGWAALVSTAIEAAVWGGGDDDGTDSELERS
jgi:hypothetical protein